MDLTMRKWKTPSFIFLTALLLRLIFGVFLLPPRQQNLSGDASEYDLLARNLIAGRGFTDGENYSQRVPAYPLFLAAIYSIFGHHYPIVRFLQRHLGVWVCFLIYRIAVVTYGASVGLISASFAAIYPPFIRYLDFGGPGFFLSENLLVPLLAMSVLCFLYLAGGRGPLFAVGAGLFLGLSALTRPEVAFLVFCLIFWLIFFSNTRRQYAVRQSFILLAVFFTVLLPWVVRNYRVHHRVIVLTTKLGEGLFSANNAAARGGYVAWHMNPDYDPKAYEGFSELDRNQAMTRNAIIYLKTHPLRIPELALRKVLVHWNVFVHIAPGKTSYNVGYAIALMLAVIGFTSSWRVAKHKGPTLFLSLFVYFSMVAAIICGDTRYRTPSIDPYLLVLAGAGTFYLFQRRGWRQATSLMGLVIFMNGTVFLFWDHLYPFIHRLTP